VNQANPVKKIAPFSRTAMAAIPANGTSGKGDAIRLVTGPSFCGIGRSRVKTALQSQDMRGAQESSVL
jgi:hypothetical protein